MFAGRGVLAGRENERTAPTQVSISAERSKGYGRTAGAAMGSLLGGNCGQARWNARPLTARGKKDCLTALRREKLPSSEEFRAAGRCAVCAVCACSRMRRLPLGLCLLPHAVLPAQASAQPLVPEANSGSLRTLMFHVHKTGGTTLCHMAKRNGERASSNNCNVGEKGTSFCWACDREQAAALSSDAEASYLSSVPYTFGANECLAPLEPEAGVLTLTSLREPLERAASHFFYDLNDQGPLARKRTAGNCSSFNCFVLQRMEHGDYQRYHWHNYMTRFFSSTAHAGPIGEAELERAKARLAGVDVLIDLADFEACMEPLKARLHWNDTRLDQAESMRNVHGGGTRTVKMSPKAHRKLTEANQLDLALYEHFRLAVARQHQARAEREREGESHQAPTERRTQAAPAPEMEHAFYGDAIRIVVTDGPAPAADSSAVPEAAGTIKV